MASPIKEAKCEAEQVPQVSTKYFETYKGVIAMAPGPTVLYRTPELERVYSTLDYGSTDLEHPFVSAYEEAEGFVKKLLNTSGQHSIVIQTGEAMVCLWGALKSVLKPGDRVLAIATGIYGYGIGDMAKSIGAEVKVIGLEHDEALGDGALPQSLIETAESFKPTMITVVHCETPSGTLNSLAELGKLSHRLGSLFYVDFVSSGAATEIRVADWYIDLGLLGSQKALSLPPDLGIVSVSSRAWDRICEIKYVGYDALLPWKKAVESKYFPYTHNWRAVAALNAVLRHLIQEEGLPNVFKRHQEVAAYVRNRVKQLGLKLFPKKEEWSSPTVTAVYVPDGWTWPELNAACRAGITTDTGKCENLVLGENYGKLENKIFRIGHMGSQAQMELAKRALDVLEHVLKTRPTGK